MATVIGTAYQKWLAKALRPASKVSCISRNSRKASTVQPAKASKAMMSQVLDCWNLACSRFQKGRAK